MNSAIDQFVDNGKFKFKDFAGSVIRDLIRIQLKAQAVALLSRGLNFLFGGVGANYSLATGTPFTGIRVGGGETGVTPGNNFGGGFKIPGLARGGLFEGGKPYWVGEDGPELIIPQGAGTVIPNDKLGGGGGPSIVNNYNITGYTDEQLVRKVQTTIAQNPKLVYGSSKRGERDSGINSFT